MTYKNLPIEEKIKQIREQDIVPVLEGALNYGEPTKALYLAALEEITELRQTVLSLGGTLQMHQPWHLNHPVYARLTFENETETQ